MGKIADGGALGGVGWGREVGGVRRRERFAGDVLLAIGRLWGEDVFRGGISGVYCRIRGLFGGGRGLGGFWVGLGRRRGGLFCLWKNFSVAWEDGVSGGHGF